MKKYYRVHIDNEAEYSEEFKGDVINVNKVMEIIDEIEGEINEIKDMLKPFTILTEIENVYNLLADLRDKLY